MSKAVQDASMEATFQELLTRSKKKMVIGIVLLVFGIMALLAGAIFTLPICFVLGAALAVVGYIFTHLSKSAIRKFTSEKLVPIALNSVMEDVQYEPNNRLSDITLRTDMGFPFSFDEISGNDYIRGSYRGMQVEMSDVKLVDVQVVATKNGTRTQRTTVFQGPWIVCDFGKDLVCDLLLSERTALGKLTTVGGIKTESEDFNKRFFIRCLSEHDAFYLLTPHMMERILEMDDRTNGDSYLRFQANGKVILALNCHKNFFEPDLSAKKVEDLQKKYQDEINHLLGLLDTLRLAESMK